jgi:hypothetical protein
MRAEIMALLNRNPDQELTLQQISAQCKELIDAVGYNEGNVYSFLYNMVKMKQLKSRKDGQRVLYRSKNSTVSNGNGTAIVPVKVTKPVNAVTTHVATNTPPHVKLDIIKETGRVRLEFGGIVLDIGVK